MIWDYVLDSSHYHRTDKAYSGFRKMLSELNLVKEESFSDDDLSDDDFSDDEDTRKDREWYSMLCPEWDTEIEEFEIYDHAPRLIPMLEALSDAANEFYKEYKEMADKCGKEGDHDKESEYDAEARIHMQIHSWANILINKLKNYTEYSDDDY